jgi:enamine deaminase RidA (YjgF/YER057c/UK114 family)
MGWAEISFQQVILGNIEKVLKAAGTSLENAVKVNIYLADLQRDFKAMNEVYQQARGSGIILCLF